MVIVIIKSVFIILAMYMNTEVTPWDLPNGVIFRVILCTKLRECNYVYQVNRCRFRVTGIIVRWFHIIMLL